MKKLYVVRVVIPNIPENAPPLQQRVDGAIIECLRYAGIVNVHYDDEKGQCFDIYPPKHYWSESKRWSEMNAERMETYGFNAASAPSTEEPKES